MAKPSDDHGLEVLVETLKKEKSRVPESLLRQCYEIQRAFQYDKDREVPLDRMRKLVEAEVATAFEAQAQEKGRTQ